MSERHSLSFIAGKEEKRRKIPSNRDLRAGTFFPLLPGIFLKRFLSQLGTMKPLGICWIAYGILRVCLGVALLLFEPTATVMFGALLGRVADPFTLMGLFHAVYILAIVLSFLCGILGIAGGLAILGNARAGRGLLIVASLLALSEMPGGIALGVYTLILLVPARSGETIPAK
jgi:hypothetical protein